MLKILKCSGYIFKHFRPRSEGSYSSPLILAETVWKCNVDSLEQAVRLKWLKELKARFRINVFMLITHSSMLAAYHTCISNIILGKKKKWSMCCWWTKIPFFTMIKKLLQHVFLIIQYYNIFSVNKLVLKRVSKHKICPSGNKKLKISGSMKYT